MNHIATSTSLTAIVFVLATGPATATEITPRRFTTLVHTGMERAVLADLMGAPSVESCTSAAILTTCRMVWQPLLSVHRYRVTLINGRVVTYAVCTRSGLLSGESQCAGM